MGNEEGQGKECGLQKGKKTRKGMKTWMREAMLKRTGNVIHLLTATCIGSTKLV